MPRKLKVSLAFIALLIVAAAAYAGVELTTEQDNQCRAEGGCVLASKDAIRELMQKAYAAGRERGSISCGNRT